MAIGETSSVISAYTHAASLATEWSNDEGKSEVRNQYFNVRRFAVVDSRLATVSRSVTADEDVGILIEGDAEENHPALTVGFAVYASNSELLFWALHTDTSPDKWPKIQKGRNRLLAWLPRHFLNEGDYRVELILSLHYIQWISQPGVNAPSLQFSIRGGLSASPFWMMARPGVLGPTIPFELV